MLKELHIKPDSPYSKSLLFRVGNDAGFFSEYNGMIFTLHYCLNNNIRFLLNSNSANFSFNKGWGDYFLPYEDECQFFLNKYYNTRLAPPATARIRDKIGLSVFKLFLKLRRIDLVTWQVLSEALNQKAEMNYPLPNSGLNGTLFENCRKLSELVWQFRPEIKTEIEKISASLIIPEPYIGFHIRRGDKKTETTLIPVVKYFLEAEKHTPIRNGFVSTDDYSVIEELKEKFPSWTIYTLTTAIERGYSQNVQARKSKLQVRSEMIRLFAEVELLAKSELFFGTFSSNVSLYMAWRIQPEKCFGVDFREWKILS
jgi:hypothetical protein